MSDDDSDIDTEVGLHQLNSTLQTLTDQNHLASRALAVTTINHPRRRKRAKSDDDEDTAPSLSRRSRRLAATFSASSDDEQSHFDSLSEDEESMTSVLSDDDDDDDDKASGRAGGLISLASASKIMDAIDIPPGRLSNTKIGRDEVLRDINVFCPTICLSNPLIEAFVVELKAYRVSQSSDIRNAFE
jgi:hypothetical protein